MSGSRKGRADACLGVKSLSGACGFRRACRVARDTNKRRAERLLPPNIHAFLKYAQHTLHFTFRTMASSSKSHGRDVEAQRDVLQPHRAPHPLIRYCLLG